MKQLFILLVAAAAISSCSLTSQTQIGPRKEFELGDGKHGAFTVTVKNVSNTAVEVYQQPLGGQAEKLATLNNGESKTVHFAANTKAIFKNLDSREAALKLKLTGDTGLSMGGPNY